MERRTQCFHGNTLTASAWEVAEGRNWNRIANSPPPRQGSEGNEMKHDCHCDLSEAYNATSIRNLALHQNSELSSEQLTLVLAKYLKLPK